MRLSNSNRFARLRLEQLENRSVPATINLTNGTLTVVGSGAADQIDIARNGSTLVANGQPFDAGQVRLITVDAGEGDDTVTVSTSVTVPAWIFGGGGNDRLTAGGGASTIYGGLGDDTIVGGAAADVVYGGLGTDSITAQANDSVTQEHAFASASPSAIAQEIVRLVNAQRAAAGLSALQISGQLTAAAQSHSRAMAELAPIVGYRTAMSHTLMGAPQPTLAARAAAVGFEYRALGENIAYGYGTAESVMTAWMSSAGHRANILNAMYTHVGVAVAYTGDGMPYYTQEFGTPTAYNPTSAAPVTGSGVATTPGSSPTPPVTPPTPLVVPPPPPILQPPTRQSPDVPPPVRPVSGVRVTDGFAAGPSQAGQLYATGTGGGTLATVTVYDLATGTMKFRLQPYGSGFRGAIRVAVGDVTGDGRQDIVVAPGAGISSLVRVYDGGSGTLVRSFYAYDARWYGGVFVAVGDVTGDGRADIVTGADAGGALVRAFDGRTGQLFRSFYAYPNYAGGVRVAVGDVNGDGRGDIVTAPGRGTTGAPVRVFSGANNTLMGQFAVHAPSWTDGLFVAAGDVDGDGRADIVTGVGAQVKVFSGIGFTLLSNFVTDTSNIGGVRVMVRDFTGDGQAEILTAQGAGGRGIRLHSSGGTLLASYLSGNSAGLNGSFVG